MPATVFSHQALVVPLKMRWPHRFSGLALCIGSMAPDLAFLGTMSDDSIFSHTLSAQLWFTPALTALLVWLLTVIMLPALLPYVREHGWWRVHDLAAIDAPTGWRGWARVATSASLGGISHVLVDGITHGNHSGWLVPSLPFLRTMVPHIGGPVPLHDALQCWFTILFGLATAWMWRDIARRRLLWAWRGKHVMGALRMPRAAGNRLLALCGIAAALGASVGWYLRRHEPAKLLAAGIGFGIIDFVFVALLIAALVQQWRTRWRAMWIASGAPVLPVAANPTP
ncbi:MAG: DUF4184 family protein [Gemmatimonadaceae bacterium]|nr:DUF4184 family protein [Gemmatimonadaceae bacterium]